MLCFFYLLSFASYILKYLARATRAPSPSSLDASVARGSANGVRMYHQTLLAFVFHDGTGATTNLATPLKNGLSFGTKISAKQLNL